MRVLWLTGIVIVLDQATKMLVMRTMYLGQQIPLIGDWLKLTYTENPGMAFGITFGPRGMVTVFSVIATFLITLYLFKVRKGYLPYRASLAFILGGALGNIIDRVFYGAVFGGDSLFVGRVVDFIHVNVWNGFIPESLPVIGGTYLSLFPIWNVADMAIVCGVVGILYFQKRFHYADYYGSVEASDELPIGAHPTEPKPVESDLAASNNESATGIEAATYGNPTRGTSSAQNESLGLSGHNAQAEPAPEKETEDVSAENETDDVSVDNDTEDVSVNRRSGSAAREDSDAAATG